MKRLSKAFLSGLAAAIPLIVTAYVIYWVGAALEAIGGSLIRLPLPEGVYQPGMGFIAGLVLILLLGLFMQAWIFRSLFAWAEQLLAQVPLIKHVYGAARDLTDFISGTQAREFNRVVAVQLPGTEIRLLGFVTRDDIGRVVNGLGSEDETIAVYLPMSYMIGGYTAFLPASAVTPVDMSLREGMRFAVTGGLSSEAR